MYLLIFRNMHMNSRGRELRCRQIIGGSKLFRAPAAHSPSFGPGRRRERRTEILGFFRVEIPGTFISKP